MRTAKDTDFFIELPDVGVFRFGRRTYGDRLAIRAAYLRLVKEFGDSDGDLSMYAAIIACHSVLCVEAPAGWENLAELDLTAPGDVETKVLALYSALKHKEDSFRLGQPQVSETAGA
jgi:hypothetical protein